MKQTKQNKIILILVGILCSFGLIWIIYKSIQRNKNKKERDEQEKIILDELDKNVSDDDSRINYDSLSMSIYDMLFPLGGNWVGDSDEDGIIRILNMLGASRYQKLKDAYKKNFSNWYSSTDLTYDLTYALNNSDMEKINFKPY